MNLGCGRAGSGRSFSRLVTFPSLLSRPSVGSRQSSQAGLLGQQQAPSSNLNPFKESFLPFPGEHNRQSVSSCMQHCVFIYPYHDCACRCDSNNVLSLRYDGHSVNTPVKQFYANFVWRLHECIFKKKECLFLFYYSLVHSVFDILSWRNKVSLFMLIIQQQQYKNMNTLYFTTNYSVE